MTPDHIARYRLYDREGREIARGQAALDGWRPGLTSRWIVPDDEPKRGISPLARFRGRRRRLRKRLAKRLPLLAAELEERILAERPEYYGLGPPVTHDATRAATALTTRPAQPRRQEPPI